MKSFYSLLFAVMLTVPSLALAQETAPAAGDTPLQAGTMSLMFSFGGAGLIGGHFLAGAPADPDEDDEYMEPMNGLGAAYGAGGRYYINEQLAVRASLALQNTSRDFEGAESSFFKLGLGGGVQYHLITTGKVSLYAGGLLGFYMGTIEEEGQTDTDITGFGLYGVLGAEYYINRGLSIGAEYMLGFTSTSAEVGDFSTDFTDISIQTFSFHLGFHF